RHRAQAAGRQLRLPLPAPELGHRGQRAAEAPRHRQAREAPRVAGRQGDRPARPRLQAQHRRHARGVLARPVGASAGGGRPRPGLRPRRRGRGAQAHLRRRLQAVGGRGRRRRRCGRARHGVARVRRDGSRRAGRPHARLAPGRRTQLPGSGARTRGRADLRGDRPSLAQRKRRL
ncbi:MAG: UDP-glucose 6-dehydrogenase, partial [uncultured Solirubrobacteraceae bacterium]